MSEPRCAWSYFSEKHETGFASEKVALLLTMGYVGEAVALFKKKKKRHLFNVLWLPAGLI